MMNTSKLKLIVPLALLALGACMASDPGASPSPAAETGDAASGLALAPVICRCECGTNKEPFKGLCAVPYEFDWDTFELYCPDKNFDMGTPANCGAMNNQACRGYTETSSERVGGSLIGCAWQTEDAEVSSNE
jgi:hypothetical protein